MLLNRSRCVFYKWPGSMALSLRTAYTWQLRLLPSSLAKQSHFALCSSRTLPSLLWSKGIREDIRAADTRGTFGRGPADHVTLLACAGVSKKRKPCLGSHGLKLACTVLFIRWGLRFVFYSHNPCIVFTLTTFPKPWSFPIRNFWPKLTAMSYV